MRLCDGAAMAKMLDPDVIFFNETGEKATRADTAGATPVAAGASIRTIATTDWHCRVYGDVVVTSFIDVLEQGKPAEMKFRSVETWRRQGGASKMIGSETLTLQEDPDPVALDGMQSARRRAAVRICGGDASTSASRRSPPHPIPG